MLTEHTHAVVHSEAGINSNDVKFAQHFLKKNFEINVSPSFAKHKKLWFAVSFHSVP